jgi:hypothetical protein
VNKAYTNWITWVNYPSTNSPINETALNLLSNAVDTIDDRVVTFDTTKANQSDLLLAIKAISFNQSTGTFVFTLFNNNTITIDTDIEKIAVNFDYDDDPTSAHYQSLVLTLSDGTIKYIDLSALITQYEFDDTSTIHANVSSVSGHVSFNVIDGSITASKLDPSVLASIQASVAAAEAHMLNSQAWAEGKKGSTDVGSSDPQYHNNSKYFANLSEAYSQDSEAWAEGTINGQPVPSTDPHYHHDAKYWAGQAQSIVGSKVDSFNGRTGVVVPAQDDYTIGQIKATGTQGQVPTLNAQGKLEMATPASSGHTIQTPGGTDLTQRSTLQFSGGSASVNVYDDPTNQKTVVEIGNVHSYTISTSDWVSNTDSDASEFPYIAVITPNFYPFSAAFIPSEVLLLGALTGDYPTSAELEEMAKVDIYVKFTSTSIRVRATEAPGTTLNLVIKK